MRQRDGHGVHHAAEVDVHGVDERLRAVRLLDRQDAGVGAHDVEPSERLDAVVDRGAQLIALAHVGLGGDDLLAGALDA